MTDNTIGVLSATSLVVRKNALLKVRKWQQTLLEIILPALFTACLIPAWLAVGTDKQEATTYVDANAAVTNYTALFEPLKCSSDFAVYPSYPECSPEWVTNDTCIGHLCMMLPADDQSALGSILSPLYSPNAATIPDYDTLALIRKFSRAVEIPGTTEYGENVPNALSTGVMTAVVPGAGLKEQSDSMGFDTTYRLYHAAGFITVQNLVNWWIVDPQQTSHPATDIMKVLSFFFSNYAFAQGIDQLCSAAGSGTPLAWDTAGRGGYSFATVIWWLFMSNVLYLLLSLYFDMVLPSEWGAKKPFYFVCDPRYWLGLKYKKNEGYRGMSADEEQPAGSELREVVRDEELMKMERVSIKNVTKEFNNDGAKRMANDNVSLSLYEGQILALLGHNGAGKTTLINMLTGMLPLTSGDATVYGHSIVSDMAKKLGVGYNLKMDLSGDKSARDRRIPQITLLLKNEIGHEPAGELQKVELLASAGAELTYRIPMWGLPSFATLFEALEQRGTEYGITNFGMSVTTLEEIFIKVAHDATPIVPVIQSGTPTAQTPLLNGGNSQTLDDNLKCINIDESDRLHGRELTASQWKGLFYKRLRYSVRDRKTNIVMAFNFTTGVVLVLVVFILKVFPSTEVVGEVLRYVFRLIPCYCLGDGMVTMAQLPAQRRMGVTDDTAWAMDVIGWDILFLALSFPFYMLAALAHDFPQILYKLKLKKQGLVDTESPTTDIAEDEDVALERKTVLKGRA
eukprot:gene8363-12897_t